LRVPRPNEEKYTFSAIFEITETSQVVNQWFGRTVIYSDQRFAYEEAQYIIETKDDTIQKKFRLLELHIKFQQKLLLQR
jgi:ribonuclease R